MTTTVDVLAVLSRADDVLISTGREDLHALAAELNEVRAVFSELVAAAREGLFFHENVASRLRAALARIGGAT